MRERGFAMTKIVAHRGASAYAPENTLEAFRLAVEMGADGVELDVHLTRDGQLAVCHDENIARVAGVKGVIKDMTLAELKACDFGCRFPQYRGAKMPTLDEVYALLAPTGLTVNVELKTNVYAYEGIEEKCAQAAERWGMTGRVYYSSFNFVSLERVKKVDPALPTALLYGRAIPDIEDIARRLGAEALHPDFSLMYAPGAMERAARAGLKVRPWTVDGPEDIRRLADMGAESIITNVPDQGEKCAR